MHSKGTQVRVLRSGLDLTRGGVACAGKLSDPYGPIVLFDLLNVGLQPEETVKHVRMIASLHYIMMFATLQKRTFTLPIVQASAQHRAISACADTNESNRRTAVRRECEVGEHWRRMALTDVDGHEVHSACRTEREEIVPPLERRPQRSACTPDTRTPM